MRIKILCLIFPSIVIITGCSGITRQVYEGQRLSKAEESVIIFSNPWITNRKTYYGDIKNYTKYEADGSESSGSFIIKGKKYYFLPGYYHFTTECKNGTYIAYRSADILLEAGKTYTVGCRPTYRNRDVEFKVVDTEINE